MRKRWRVGFAWLFGLIAMSFLGAARAEGEGGAQPATGVPQHGPWSRAEVGLRTGYGIPFGKVTRDADLEVSDIISGQVPMVVELGARVGGHLSFGLYYSYGFGLVGGYFRETCDELEAALPGATVDVSCYARSHRAGIQLGYHIRPTEQLDPWLAAGIGHEFLDFTLSSASDSGSRTTTIDADGMELINVHVGLDVRLSEHFRAGPFLGATMTTYGTYGRRCRGPCGDEGNGGDVQDGENHAWLFFGLRGVWLH